jgi:Domain of unknown function (DUF4265)
MLVAHVPPASRLFSVHRGTKQSIVKTHPHRSNAMSNLQVANSSSIEIHVPLNPDEDRYPDVANEALVCERAGLNYRIVQPPLFLRGLAAGDIIAVTKGDDNWVSSWKLVLPSDQSTIWLLLQSHTAQTAVTSVLAKLHGLGCQSSELCDYGRYAICVPKCVPITQVDNLIGTLNVDSQDPAVAIAYPAFRHDE